MELCQSYEIDGCVIGNTTTRRENLKTPQSVLDSFGFGGVSGKPLKKYVQEMVGKVFRKTGGKFPIVALGGVGCDPEMHPAQEVWEYLNMGATSGPAVHRFDLPRSVAVVCGQQRAGRHPSPERDLQCGRVSREATRPGECEAMTNTKCPQCEWLAEIDPPQVGTLQCPSCRSLHSWDG